MTVANERFSTGERYLQMIDQFAVEALEPFAPLNPPKETGNAFICIAYIILVVFLIEIYMKTVQFSIYYVSEK